MVTQSELVERCKCSLKLLVVETCITLHAWLDSELFCYHSSDQYLFGMCILRRQNLEQSIDSEALHHTFSAIGVVLSCKVERHKSGRSLGYGYIQFQDKEDAEQAIRLVNGMLLKEQQVFLEPFIPRFMDCLEAARNVNPAHVPAVSSTSYSNVRIPSTLIASEFNCCRMQI